MRLFRSAALKSILALIACAMLMVFAGASLPALQSQAAAQQSRQNLYNDPFRRFRALFPNSVVFSQGSIWRQHEEMVTKDWVYKSEIEGLRLRVVVLDFDDEFANTRSSGVGAWVASRDGLELVLGEAGLDYEITKLRSVEAFGKSALELTAFARDDSGRVLVMYSIPSATRVMAIIIMADEVETMLGPVVSQFATSFQFLKLED